MIKKTISLLLLLTLVEHAMAQSRQETEDWIIHQTKVNPYGLKHRIEGNELISRLELPSVTIGGGIIEKAIPIGQITTIAYTHTNEYLSYAIQCDRPCAFLLDESDKKQSKFLFEIYKKLDASYVPRMNTALLHLVKLHGGKAKIVRAEAVKQAF